MDLTKTYQFTVPSKIVTGVGSSQSVGAEAARLGGTKVLLVTDSGMVGAGYADQIRSLLDKEGLAVEVFDGVQPDPTMKNVEDGLDVFRKGGCDLVVALGGGSSIDAAKGVSVMSTNEGSIRDYMGIEKLQNPGAPLIAIPTTTGTGSEVTKACVITDTENNVKMLLMSINLVPRVALVDPLLTLTMPRDLTAATGIDALTHAIEAYVSVKAQPITDVLALSAIRLISGNLRQAWADGKNLRAKANTMLGATEAGMAFSNSSVALVHGMSRPLGAYFHVPHGLSNAVLLPEVIRFSLVGNPRRYADVGAIMGESVHGLSDMEGASVAARTVEALNHDVQIPTLSQIGIGEEKLNEVVHRMAEDALASGSPDNNPRKASKEEIVELYRRCL